MHAKLFGQLYKFETQLVFIYGLGNVAIDKHEHIVVLLQN
jgi:hypothetical protein